MLYRLDLTETEYEIIKNILITHTDSGLNLKKIMKPKIIKISDSKRLATNNANRIKIQNSKNKVTKAIEELKNKKLAITPYQIAKISGVSFYTAKKYFNKVKN